MKKFFGIMFLMVILVTLAACGNRGGSSSDTPNLDEILERGHLVIGMYAHSPPFGYINQAGRLSGRDVAISKRLAYEMFGDEEALQFVVVEAANRIEFLRSYRVDVIMANFTKTPERAEQVDFAEPYSLVALAVIAAENSNVNSIGDLAGRSLIVTQGTIAEIYFTQNHPEINIMAFPNNVASYDALKDGRADAMAHDNTLLFSWVYNNPGFKVVEGNIGNQDFIAPAVRKETPDLLNWLNETILKLRREGFFEEVFEETMRHHFSPDVKPSDVMVLE